MLGDELASPAHEKAPQLRQLRGPGLEIQADTRLAGDIEGLRTALYDLEKVSTEIDARALPLVVLGIVLTGIGD